jgi:transposase
MRKIIKIVLIILVIIFIAIQFFRPEKNTGEEMVSSQIGAKHFVPENVQQILKVSCYDCHSNTTKYPWYWHVQPGAWILSDHFIEGKRELNFSVFSTYPAYRRYKKFKEINEQVKEGEMPLTSYTLMHREAVLTADEKLALENWTDASIKEMENQYPADSLKRPK